MLSNQKRKKRVFLSFIKEDEPSVNGLRLLKSNDSFDIEFYDESVRTAIDSVNASYIKQKIRDKISRSSVTVCLISTNTYRSAWVAWELKETDIQRKPIIAMALKGVTRAVLPSIIRSKGLAFHPWDYGKLADLIAKA